MDALSQLLDSLGQIPTDTLVEALGRVHRNEEPGPLQGAVKTPEEREPASDATTHGAAARSPARPEPTTAPKLADSLHTAHANLVEHHELMSDYAERIARYLDHVGPSQGTRLPGEVVQQAVQVQRSPGSLDWNAELVLRNPTERSGVVRLLEDGAPHRVALEPVGVRLEPGEVRTFRLVGKGPSADLGVAIGGELALHLCVVEPGCSTTPATESSPQIALEEPPDELTEILRQAQLLLLRHPLAAQAVFRSFVAEGRAYAKTDEGAKLQEQLADSALIRRGRVLWEVGTLQLLEEQAPTLLPTKLLDAFVQVAASEELETDLLRLFGAGDEHEDPLDAAAHERL